MKKIFLCAMLLSSMAFAKTTLKTEASRGTVVFSATAIGLKFQGKGEGPQGEVSIDQNVTGSLKFKMESLDTGIGLRNQHMKDKYLEVAKYPFGELKIEEVTGFDVSKTDGQFPFKGTITVHNATKAVAGMVDIKKTANGYQIKAEFDTKISNFSIPLPAYAGVALKDDVKIVVESQFM